MPVPVSWVLAQSDLALRLRGGAKGVARGIDLALTSELASPFRWLSGGELLLTTGIALPPTTAERVAYLSGLDDCNVAAVGFATGLTHIDVPADLVSAADEIDLPLFEVPLQTPFAAVIKRVMARLAELQYDAVLRASREQKKFTRIAISGGARSIVQQLARTLKSNALIVDASGAVAECHPRALDAQLLSAVHSTLSSGASSGSTNVAIDAPVTWITHQRISVARKSYGDLVVLSRAPLSHIDQLLLAHANSLLALDFAKPARLQQAQQQLNSRALGLVLGGEVDLDPAWTHLAQVADPHRQIRALVVDCDTAAALDVVRAALAAAIDRAGHELFLHVARCQLTAVLPGVASTHFLDRLATELGGSTRGQIRVGVSGAQPFDQLVDAVDNARLAASAAERGGIPVDFTTLAGRALLCFDASHEVLDAVADTMLTPIVEYDRIHSTNLLVSLRAFLEANGHWESAASAVGLHRHTLRKRIRTAQTLLGCDLDTARVRAELLLAILARQTPRRRRPSAPES